MIDNASGALRPGQFVRVTITLPPLAPEVVLPASALVEQGGQTFVFVQPDPAKAVYRLRRVRVVRRGQDVAHVRGSLKPGECIIAAGAVELKAILDTLTRRKAP